MATAVYQTADTQPLQLVRTEQRDSKEAHSIRPPPTKLNLFLLWEDTAGASDTSGGEQKCEEYFWQENLERKRLLRRSKHRWEATISGS